MGTSTINVKPMVLKMAAALLLTLPAAAQNVRISTLQNARNLVVTEEAQQQSNYYMVTAEKSQMIYRHNGQLTIGNETFDPTTGLKLRLKAMPRLALDEDNTDFDGKDELDHGLVAFRRTFCLGKWNALVVPFSLTAEQLRDAFGDDVQLAMAVSAGDAEADGETTTATLEFQTVDLTADGAGLQAGVHYLIKPTREPDIAEGEQTSVVYGSSKVAGPLYAIPGVTLTKGNSSPDNLVLRSPSDEVRLRFFGTYTSRTGNNQVKPGSRPLYILGSEGHFSQLLEPSDVKAFRSWLENASKTDGIQLRFCLDGVSEELTEPTGISTINRASITNNRYYNLNGQRVNGQIRPGIYVVNGKKVIIRK